MENDRTIPIHTESDPQDQEELSNVENSDAATDESIDWQAEAEKFKDLYLRTQAEAENMKKRLEREKNDFKKFANENLIKEMLPVIDNLERALSHAENSGTDLDGFVQGVRLTQEGILNVLEKFGVKPVEALGNLFDPNFHEAVMQRDAQGDEPNTVLEEMQKGYLLHDRLIRPAMVVVSK